MRTFGSPFSLCLFEPGDASSTELDKALKIYRENTSPLLATRSNQIRAKVAAPLVGANAFYFASLMRSRSPVGFAMFGYYPVRRILVFDHLVVDRHCRGENAFYAFAQLLREAVDKMSLEFDFTVVEVEKDKIYGGGQTGGAALVRLLGHVGFCEVHADYRIADLEPGRSQHGHPGILMIRGPEKIHRMPRGELLAIHEGVLFDHYLPWCETFLGDRTSAYRRELKLLHEAFAARLPDEISMNGAEEDGLLPTLPIGAKGGVAVRHVAGYVAMIAVTTAVALALKIGPFEVASLLVCVLAVYAGIDLVGSGKSQVVFEQALAKLPGSTRKLPNPPTIRSRGGGTAPGRSRQSGSPNVRRP